MNSRKFSQELRLVSPSDRPLEWLIGAFYTNEKNKPFYNLVASDLVTGEVVDEFFPDRYPNSYKEYAAFASLTYHFNDRLDLQIGGRYGHNKQVFDESITGPFYDPPYSVHAESDENVFTYSITPRFRISPNMTLYGRVASGYRRADPIRAPASASRRPIAPTPPSITRSATRPACLIACCRWKRRSTRSTGRTSSFSRSIR